MTAPVFVDTNVFLYALDDRNRRKQEMARLWRSELWKSRLGRVSFQVLQEFYANVASKWPSARDEARAEIRDLLAWRPLPVNAEIILKAWKLQDRYDLSFWDSLIVASAQVISCKYLLTEDLQHGQDLDGHVVVSPFRSSPQLLE